MKTEVIDKDFTTLANLQIAIAYSRIAEKTGDDTNYDKALQHIEEVSPNATIAKHQEGLTFLWDIFCIELISMNSLKQNSCS